ncbi:MAG: DUF3667 domain-containing protein [Lacibacter sp.]
MSHGRERKEKNCLNCNARVFGRFCHVCGQENTEPKETAWDLVVHFFNDITHFEGKFITSLRYLIFKPGFLTAEYIRGRRASYMNPVRMYVFTSAFFFIFFFSFFSTSSNKHEKKESKSAETTQNNQHDSTGVTDKKDTVQITQTPEQRNPVKNRNELNLSIDSSNDFYRYSSVAEYDSVQQTLPADKKANWITRQISRRLINVNSRYDYDISAFSADLLDYVLHSLPKMLFVSLPFFALLFSLLYIRKKQFYYVGHLIFTIHLFVFFFLFLLVIFSIGKLEDNTAWNFGWLKFLLWISVFVYLYKAMRRMYQQGRSKTILKFILLMLLAFLLNIFLFTAFFSYSFFNI